MSRPPRGALLLVLLAMGLPAPDSRAGDVPDYVQVRAFLDHDVYHEGSQARVVVQFDIDPRVHVNSHDPKSEFQFPTSLTWDELPEGLTLSELSWPEPEMKAFEFTDGEKIAVLEGRQKIRLTASIAPGTPPGALKVTGTFQAQGCTHSTCYAPQKDPVRFTVRVVGADEEPEAINEAHFLAEEPREEDDGAAETAIAAAALPPLDGSDPALEQCDTIVASSATTDKPLPLLFLLCFVSGIGLAFTPCVLPLVPITIGFFSRQQSAGGRPVGMAALYVLGLALVYSLLGTAAALSGGLFGSALQKPAVLVGIALILVALATSMFGLWNLQLPSALSGRIGGAKSGYAGAVAMGGAMGLIAAPCVGPLVVSLLTYVASLGADESVSRATAGMIGGSLFFVLALGIGTPFFLVGLGIASVQPGAWMESIKKVFGFAILGVALFLVRPILPGAAFAIALMVLLGAMSVFLFLPTAAMGVPRLRMPLRVLGVVSAVSAIVVGAWLLRPAAAEGEAAHGPTFAAYSNTLVDEARLAGRPVMIDFMAEWCIACKELEHRTFPAPEVQEELADFVLLKADLTATEDPAVLALRQRFDILGLPTVVFLAADGEEVRELRLTDYEKPEDFAFRLRCVTSFFVARGT